MRRPQKAPWLLHNVHVCGGDYLLLDTGPFSASLLLVLFVSMELDCNNNDLCYFLVMNTFVMCCKQTGKGISFTGTVSVVSLFAANYVF